MPSLEKHLLGGGRQLQPQVLTPDSNQRVERNCQRKGRRIELLSNHTLRLPSLSKTGKQEPEKEGKVMIR